MSTIGGIVFIGIAVMLLLALIPGTMLMVAFSSDDGKLNRRRIVVTTLLVGSPMLILVAVFLRVGWNLLYS